MQLALVFRQRLGNAAQEALLLSGLGAHGDQLLQLVDD
jgi:hypothetical protein